jgi:hypothetical protein
MSDNLDSRALRNTDCYGQRFMTPGTYPYALVPAGGAGASGDFPYIVEVVENASEREGDMHQTTVTVRFVKERHGDCCDERTADPGRFVPDEGRVTIEAGDMIELARRSHPPVCRRRSEGLLRQRCTDQRVRLHHVFTTPVSTSTSMRTAPTSRHGAGGRPSRDHHELQAWQSPASAGDARHGQRRPARARRGRDHAGADRLLRRERPATITDAPLVADRPGGIKLLG